MRLFIAMYQPLRGYWQIHSTQEEVIVRYIEANIIGHVSLINVNIKNSVTYQVVLRDLIEPETKSPYGKGVLCKNKYRPIVIYMAHGPGFRRPLPPPPSQTT